MKVSVLMPIYNTKEEYLRTAIESILNQTYKDYEFLIYDDASNIDLQSIVMSYNDERIIYKKFEKNQEISKIRNELVKDSRGEYLAIMDHDDISLPERFEKQVKLLDNNPNIGVVGCWHGFVGNNKIFKRPVSNKEIKNIIFWECPLHHPATMLRKSVLIENNIIYEEKYSPAEDFALWVYLFDKTDFYNIPEVLFIYRNNYENTTTVQNIKMEIGINNVLNHLITSHPREYERAEIKKKLKKHIKIMFSPLKYFLEPFAIIKYLFKLLMTKG